MNLPEEYSRLTIAQVIEAHPSIGEILQKHHIDCVTCGSSSCLLRNVVAQHTYDPQRATHVEEEINAYLAGLVPSP